MGFEGAIQLAKRGGWSLHLLDMNAEAGEGAAKQVSGTFHQVNITDYDALATVFHAIHEAEKRLDFVWANAGIVERWNFYKTNQQSPPPRPDLTTIEVDYKAAVTTTYLAQQ